jgi:hypothetical protein
MRGRCRNLVKPYAGLWPVRVKKQGFFPVSQRASKTGWGVFRSHNGVMRVRAR